MSHIKRGEVEAQRDSYNRVLASAALAETVNFDNLKTGAAPSGWSATKTGSGTAKWTVEQDDSAPSKPNVLNQSGQARRQLNGTTHPGRV